HSLPLSSPPYPFSIFLSYLMDTRATPEHFPQQCFAHVNEERKKIAKYGSFEGGQSSNYLDKT
ncbi:hypothetical protein fugu_001667, partial [Takifugu bimaculatus]